MSVEVREDKALAITGISFFGGCLSLLWALFLFLPSTVPPWWAWLIVSGISALGLSLIATFVVLLFGNKTVVSEASISKISFGKRREILRENILLIAEIALWADRYFVVYPTGYDETLMERQTSVFLGSLERTKVIQKDRRLLIIRKTKNTVEIFRRFDYVPTAVIG